MAAKNWHPGELLEISGFYWKTCTLHAGIRLDIFSRIGSESVSAESLAEETGANTDAMERLLNALTAMDLLEKRKGGRFCNTEAGKQFLVKESPDYIGWMILHHHHLVDSWRRLDEAVLSGGPVRAPATEVSEKWREAFLKGMHVNSRLQAPLVVKALDLSGRRHLLDLGGGPGTYAVHFCMANPELYAVVFDLPQSRPIAEENIGAHGMNGRIQFQAGSFHEDQPVGEFDVAWLSHIFHGEGPEECGKIIQGAMSALQPGGLIIIHEFILENGKAAPEFPALFSLNMLVGTRNGRAYAESELAGMLSDAGARNIERVKYRGPTDSGIICATVT
jgi:precorrin-6B methylase 2/predicted transcriptional regulator